MRTVLLASLGFCAAVFAQSTSDTVTSYITSESPIAKAGILANIGSHGSKSAGAKPGIVIASPSTTNPDYLYTWTRDTSLVFKFLIDQYTLGVDTTLGPLVDDYVASQAILQQVSNPSGSVSTGGLGEPKFNINETAFTGSWGRPQRDGPALRATAIITYANWLIEHSNTSYVTSTLWPVLHLDLNYVATFWNQSGFDLWEEVSSSSFFTTAVQHRALREGAALAAKLGQVSDASDYETQANNVLCFLQSYWNSADHFITANTGGGRSGKDANTLLASIHTFDSTAGCDAATFQPCSDKALANLKVYVDAFRSVYAINNGVPANEAVATGRYPEDIYFGGNPWYITTSVVAEQLYDALIVWNAQKSLQITDISLAFFRQFAPSVATGTYNSTTATFTSLTAAIKDFADGFIVVNAKHTPSNGGLAEQYDRNTGSPLSAVDLTWSYASTMTAFWAREGAVTASWGAGGLKVPTTCVSNNGPTVDATFNVVATTVENEFMFLTGSVDALKNWSPDEALAMSHPSNDSWRVVVKIPAATNIEYKYIRKLNGVVTWEADPNSSITTPNNGSMTISDVWR